ncbi:helix-turn-helix transcriptional regulator [Corynebacterium sp. A21]|uniref:helix-turn-helix transcriptional regulator n=1 Tax=Corynebacterium sp. A21 TaxID=3457318 RepID=UPI003FD17FB0
MLTIAELVDLLGVSRQTLAEMRNDGTGPAWLRVGKHSVRYPAAEVESWIQDNLNMEGEAA